MKINIFGEEGLIKRLFGKESVETPEEMYTKALALFKRKKTDEAYMYLQAAAAKGHAEAAFQMGTAIFDNKAPGSEEDAIKYYIIASDKKHPKATSNLAICYQLGRGVAVDYVKALNLLNKAIKLGDDMATFNLGQTYFLGVGVKRDEAKGWNMIESVAKKGNKQAIDYINDLLAKGYESPSKKTQQKPAPKPRRKIADQAPECEIADAKVATLYQSARAGNKAAMDELMELGGNQMNRDAMNALRKLGRIKEDLSDDFKMGTAQYIANAWKTYDVETLYIVSAWTYPGFIYREYENGKVIYETQLEDKFIEKIAEEMSMCRKQNIVPRFRIRKVNNASGYCVDVHIQGISLSSFYLDIQDNHYIGLYRVHDKNII